MKLFPLLICRIFQHPHTHRQFHIIVAERFHFCFLCIQRIAIYLHGCRDMGVKIHFYFLFRHSDHLITSILRSKKSTALLLSPQAFRLFLVLRRYHRRHEHATRTGDFDQVINNRTMTLFMVRLLLGNVIFQGRDMVMVQCRIQP